MSALLDADTNEIMASQALRSEVDSIMEEAITAAASQGRTIPWSFAQHLVYLTDNMKPYKTSMRLDAMAGRELE